MQSAKAGDGDGMMKSTFVGRILRGRHQDVYFNVKRIEGTLERVRLTNDGWKKYAYGEQNGKNSDNLGTNKQMLGSGFASG
jgi:hypothetical protein